MTNWIPEKGETYYIISDYAPDPYEYVWKGDRDDLGRLKHKVLYKTFDEAMAAKREQPYRL